MATEKPMSHRYNRGLPDHNYNHRTAAERLTKTKTTTNNSISSLLF